MKSKFFKGVLGELLADRFMPPQQNLGALSDLPVNTNIDVPQFEFKNPAPPIPVSGRKRLAYKNAVENIMKTEGNPFQAFDEEEGFDFANRKMGEALKQALDMEDFATAKKFMFENQVRFEDLGFADTEADEFIDSVLEELYYGDL
jgi:hypothetical protein